MTVFLASADLFRDERISSLLDVLLTIYTRGGPVDFGNIPGVAFIDLYTAFAYHVCILSHLCLWGNKETVARQKHERDAEKNVSTLSIREKRKLKTA